MWGDSVRVVDVIYVAYGVFGASEGVFEGGVRRGGKVLGVEKKNGRKLNSPFYCKILYR